jgi:hypothetical protein
METDRQRAIETAAHRIWEEDGRPHGRHEDHWAQAVAEVDGADKPKPRKAAAKPGDAKPTAAGAKPATKAPKEKATAAPKKPATAKAATSTAPKAPKPAAGATKKPARAAKPKA